MKSFLLIDDHVVVRSGIRVLLGELYNSSLINEAENGEAAIALLKEHTYDLVILDIQIPDTDSLSLMEYFKAKYPSLPFLIFSMSPENIYAKRFLKAGAKGYINKNAPLEEIKKAIGLVLSNRKYMSDALIEQLAVNGAKQNEENLFNKLSVREFEITTLLLNGLTISKIAATLNLGISTIGTHKGRIFEKLKIINLLELKELATVYNM
jgi:DNA-binding NarL/FixJ family response regulator